MISLFEKKSIKVDETLISQYIRNKKIAKDFAIYYDLFNKYRFDYQVDKIIVGNVDKSIKERAKKAKFDERISLLGLLIESINGYFREICLLEMTLTEYMNRLKELKSKLCKSNKNPADMLDIEIDSIKKYISTVKISSGISKDELYVMHKIISIFEELKSKLNDTENPSDTMKNDFNERVAYMKKYQKDIDQKLDNLFVFCEECFSNGQEMIILIAELTINYYSSRYISQYGSKRYYAHNKEMMFYERNREIVSQILSIED